jgi:hypothetical protein
MWHVRLRVPIGAAIAIAALTLGAAAQSASGVHPGGSARRSSRTAGSSCSNIEKGI